MDEDGDGDDVIPVPVSALTRQSNTSDMLRRAEDVHPLVDVWVTALFAGTGAEAYDPDGTAEESDGDGDGGDVEDVAVDVKASEDGSPNVTAHVHRLFRHSAGRAAFVRVRSVPPCA